MHDFLISLLVILGNVLGFYLTIIVARVIVHLLVTFNILNTTNTLVTFTHDAVAALVDPVTDKLKVLMPFLVFKSVDLSPVALFLLVQILQAFLIALALL